MQCPMISQNCILVLHCSYCSFNTLLLSNLINHFKTAHSSANCLFSLYQCRHCQLISTSCPVLTEHSLINHIEKEVSLLILNELTFLYMIIGVYSVYISESFRKSNLYWGSNVRMLALFIQS